MDSRPVRVGNAAHEQRQLDVYGEVMDALYHCHVVGLPPSPDSWSLRRALLECLEARWQEPDNGIWEVRGPTRHFTHSKVMAWVAFDRGMHHIEAIGGEGPRERWRAMRDKIHEDICEHGFDAKLGSFVQYYGSQRLDASLLMIPLVGFLPPGDARVRGTVRAVEASLMEDGLVRRYENRSYLDGLPEGEGLFLPCSFWLVDNFALMGRHDDARRLFSRLLSLANDVGLLSEEYDVRSGCLVGNFPQAFSHISLVNSARNLSRAGVGPAHLRRKR
jgi:GH15 family glucan-1,4-alpha-glucosidase